jgi:hypothetical membrane protein
MALLILLGSAGLTIGGLRSLAVFVMGPDELQAPDGEYSRVAQAYLIIGMIAIILVGIFPQWFYGVFFNIARVNF